MVTNCFRKGLNNMVNFNYFKYSGIFMSCNDTMPVSYVQPSPDLNS